jgi:predicted Fe-Mo cluster-binding NifX family protein
MRVAIPIWGEKISPVFDTAAKLLIVDVDGSSNKQTTVSLEGDDLARRCAKMKALDVDILICSAISNPFHRRLFALDIRVIQGISGTAEDVISAYMNGEPFLEMFLMPGCNRSPKKQCTDGFKERKRCNKKGQGNKKANGCRHHKAGPKIIDSQEA